MPFMPLIYEESGFFLRQAGHSFLIVWAQLNAAPLSSTTSRIGDDTLHQAGSPARGANRVSEQKLVVKPTTHLYSPRFLADQILDQLETRNCSLR